MSKITIDAAQKGGAEVVKQFFYIYFNFCKFIFIFFSL